MASERTWASEKEEVHGHGVEDQVAGLNWPKLDTLSLSFVFDLVSSASTYCWETSQTDGLSLYPAIHWKHVCQASNKEPWVLHFYYLLTSD